MEIRLQAQLSPGAGPGWREEKLQAASRRRWPATAAGLNPSAQTHTGQAAWRVWTGALAAGGRPGPVGCSLVLSPVGHERFPATVSSARPPVTVSEHSHRCARHSVTCRPQQRSPLAK